MNTCDNKYPQNDFRVISVLNYGAFIASVSLIYKFQGKFYRFNNPYLLVLQEFRINVPFGATEVELMAYANDIFQGSILLFDNKYAVAQDACFLLWGLSFTPQYKEIPCTSPGSIEDLLPKAIIIPLEALDSNRCNPHLNTLSQNRNTNRCKIKCYKDKNCTMKRYNVESIDIYK